MPNPYTIRNGAYTLKNGAYSSGSTDFGNVDLTWDSAEDWDSQWTIKGGVENSASRGDDQGIRLDNFQLGREDHEDSPYAFYRFSQGYGSTLYDWSATERNMPIQFDAGGWVDGPSRFPTVIESDPENRSSGGDFIDFGQDGFLPPAEFYEVDFWFKTHDRNRELQRIFGQFWMFWIEYNRFGNGQINFGVWGDSSTDEYDIANFGPELPENEWHHVYARWEPDYGMICEVNGGENETYAYNQGTVEHGGGAGMLQRVSSAGGPANQWFLDGEIGEFRVFASDGSSVIGDHGPNLNVEEGYLETEVKDYNDFAQPAVTDVDYDLNGGEINLRVTGSPGTVNEESVVIPLTGATTFDPTWESGHSEWEIRPRLVRGSKGETPRFYGATLSANIAQGATVIDDFDDGQLSEVYQGDWDHFSVQNDVVLQGQYSLERNGYNSKLASDNSGFETPPNYRYSVVLQTSEAQAYTEGFMIAIQNVTDDPEVIEANCIRPSINPAEDTFGCSELVDDEIVNSEVVATGQNISVGTRYLLEVDYHGSSLDARVYKWGDDTALASLSLTGLTHDSGGYFGWRGGSHSGPSRFDYARRIEL